MCLPSEVYKSVSGLVHKSNRKGAFIITKATVERNTMEKVKVGILGLGRGMSFVDELKLMADAEIVAIFDKNPKMVEQALEAFEIKPKICTSYDDLLNSGIDCVILCNYFHEHAPYAIRAFERGIAVLSECTSASTLKQCAELCDAYEKYNAKYMIAENYPYNAAMLAIEKKCTEGKFGRILYAEGEYNHSGTYEKLKELTPDKYHWRAYLARTYYSTHSLGPLMHCTKQNPVNVSAFAVHSDVLEKEIDFRYNYDAFAMMTCRTEDGALFRFNGNAHMGSPSGYRVVGENGSGETGRSLGGDVYVHYHEWTRPEDEVCDYTYTPTFDEKYEGAPGSGGHEGGDFCVTRIFLDYVKGGETPFFDVYRGCCMSAVAILGWRSCLENGRVYEIPDFRDKAQRDAVRGDDLTPFPDENGDNITLPCHT